MFTTSVIATFKEKEGYSSPLLPTHSHAKCALKNLKPYWNFKNLFMRPMISYY